ncbi:MAG TPA: SUMF1/EgtB/PvdO family nonheme iron enzyme [Thermoanaerobaculia bacterium]|nr:SUMF1/EgtB/PvdO family nonheme iron enzyme [Thermoanaerobaculia bacterium]
MSVILALLQAAPAAPPPSFWQQNGDKVLLVVVTAAVTLFFTKVLPALSAKIGKWLETAFAGLGLRFRKRYLAALADRHRWLKLIGVYNQADLHPPRLQEVYVSLRVAAGRDEDGPRFGWNEIFRPEERRLAILGSPGAGKSTLLDYLVLVFTGHLRNLLRDRLGRPFPLLARLRELGSPGSETLTALLAKSSPLKQIPAGYPEIWLKRGGCLVLLDGLDEVLDETRHAQAVEEIERLVADYPGNFYVVTCRVAGWHNQLPAFRTYEIQPFTPDDVRRFLGAWYREVLRTREVGLLGASPDQAKVQEVELRAFEEAGRRAEALWESLASNESLLRIASTPLLLSLITLVHYHRVTDLPKGRAELYEECVDVLLDLWERQDKRLQLPEVPTLKEKRMVLQTIAFHYLKEDLLEADVPTLCGLIEPLLPKLKAMISGEGLIRQIWERSGILQEKRLGFFGFAHRALHDYLAAEYLVEHQLDSLLLERVGEERWREVILIAAGLALVDRAERLVEALIARRGETGAELEMAGLALAEDIQLGVDLRAEVKRRLLERLTGEEAAGPFRRLASALVTADLEAARLWMEGELRGPDPQRQKRVLELLPELGEAQVRSLASLLVRLIGDGSGDTSVRARAAQALAGIRFLPDATTWQALELARQGELSLKKAAIWAWCELGRSADLGLVKVPAGEFLMGSKEGDESQAEQPQHVFYLSTFYVGRTPVTVGAYRDYLAKTGRQSRGRAGFDILNMSADRPVAEVSWHDALAFAEWHGFGLPSEAEWEKAARGPDGGVFPWGNEWKAGFANTAEYWGATGTRLQLPWGPYQGSRVTTPVGLFSPKGDSPYGCVDMAGNVWEWTRSLWGTDDLKPDFKYPYDPADGREDLKAEAKMLRVMRGGSYFFDSRYVRCAVRGRNESGFRDVNIGFRVVLSSFSSDL